MNVILNVFVLFFCFCVSAIELSKRDGDFSVENETSFPDGLVGDEMNSTTHMSVNHYYCSADDVEDPVTILYGTKSWTFPPQDVNLTLSYPTANADSEFTNSGEDSYIITGFKVVLYIDGMESRGYIVDGGIKQEKITLCFVSHRITGLSYQFWLYGVPKSTSGLFIGINVNHNICH